VEAVFIIVFFKKQRAEFQQTRVTVQSGLDQEGDETLKAFEDFRKAFFPYERKTSLQDYAEERGALEKWIKGGPVGLTPQLMGREKLRMTQQGEDNIEQRRQMEQLGMLRRI